MRSISTMKKELSRLEERWDGIVHSKVGQKISKLAKEIEYEKACQRHISDSEFEKALASIIGYILNVEGRDWWDCDPDDDDPSITRTEEDSEDSNGKIPFPPPLSGALAKKFGNGFSVYGDTLAVKSWLEKNRKRLRLGRK